MVKVYLNDGQVYDGEIWAIDPVTLTVIFSDKEKEGSYRIINGNTITNIDGDISNIQSPNIASLGLTAKAIEKKEFEALAEASNRMEALNFNVDCKIQMLFDTFSKTLPCEWSGVDIIVLESYVIKAPYEKVTVITGKQGKLDPSAIKRIEKMLEVERKKLNL